MEQKEIVDSNDSTTNQNITEPNLSNDKKNETDLSVQPLNIDNTVENLSLDENNQEKDNELIMDAVEKTNVDDNENSFTVENNNVDDEKNTFTVENNNVDNGKKKKMLFVLLIIAFLLIFVFAGYKVNEFVQKKKTENKKPPIIIDKDDDKDKEDNDKFVPEVVSNIDVISVSSAINEGVLADDYYFSDSVFIGDNTISKFNSYLSTKPNGFLGKPFILYDSKLSTNTLVSEVNEKSNHPVYNGTKMLVEDSVKLMGAKKVFINLGHNDILSSGINNTLSNYKTLISRIKTKNPNTKIFIINVGYMFKGTETKKMNNTLIRELNEKLKNSSATWGAIYIDMAHTMIESNGYLKEEFYSEESLLINNLGYNVWVNVLRRIASTQIEAEILSTASSLLKACETSPSYDAYNKAVKAVDRVPEGIAKVDFKNRLIKVLAVIEANYSNKLTEIKINNVAIALTSGNYNYSYNVPNDASTVNISVKKISNNAIVEGEGNVNLNLGENILKIIVKNNGEIITYTLKIYRAYDDSILKVTIDNKDIGLDTLSLTVPAQVSSVILKVTPTYSGATVTGEGTLSLVTGTNTFKFKVYEKIYTLTIIREISS
ncbi:MAG: GDSL-type esterase/lipase family protein [Bacilli bacterium]